MRTLSDGEILSINGALQAYASYTKSPTREHTRLVKKAEDEGLVLIRSEYLISWTDKGIERTRTIQANIEAAIDREIWGKNQVPFYARTIGAPATRTEIAHGVINTLTTPSTVYVFGHHSQQTAVKNVIGAAGVTNSSPVIDNSTRENLGTARAFTKR